MIFLVSLFISTGGASLSLPVLVLAIAVQLEVFLSSSLSLPPLSLPVLVDDNSEYSISLFPLPRGSLLT